MPFQSSVIRINLIHKTERIDASHTLGLRLRSDLTAIAQRDGVKLKIVELPAELSRFLRQPVKTQFSFNGELCHGIASTTC
jgi:hypothetical protein